MEDWKSKLKAFKSQVPKATSNEVGTGVKGATDRKGLDRSVSHKKSGLTGKISTTGRRPVEQIKAKGTVAIEVRRRVRSSVDDEEEYLPLTARALVSNTPKSADVQRLPVPDFLETRFHHDGGRHRFFKYPDSWVSDGSRTQASDRKRAGRVVDIYIGLDFGTSYTKAAVGISDKIFVVDWSGLSKTDSMYLLPSEFSCDSAGICEVGLNPAWRNKNGFRQKLKQPLLGSSVSIQSRAEASAFIALVVRYIRAWIYRVHGGLIGSRPIRWYLTIGSPSNGLETERLQSLYKQIACCAWVASQSEDGVNLNSVCSLVESWEEKDVADVGVYLDVKPEFVAQIAGYVQSAKRQPGLHGLVDVGGGTLDVVTFIVHERDGEDVFPFLIPEVKTLGTQMLYQNRLVGISDFDVSKVPDELSPVVDSASFSKSLSVKLSHVSERDEIFWLAVKKTVGSVLHRTKVKRYRLSDAWTKGLPVFLTGGGAVVSGYESSVVAGSKVTTSELKLMQLPFHQKLDGFSGSIDDYQRVSVACGLAQDPFALGELIPAGSVEDDIPVAKLRQREDRDDLYGR